MAGAFGWEFLYHPHTTRSAFDCDLDAVAARALTTPISLVTYHHHEGALTRSDNAGRHDQLRPVSAGANYVKFSFQGNWMHRVTSFIIPQHRMTNRCGANTLPGARWGSDVGDSLVAARTMINADNKVHMRRWQSSTPMLQLVWWVTSPLLFAV